MLNNKRGFTLIEMVVVITLVGVVMIAVSAIMTQPFQAYQSMDRRVELVDAADTALRKVARDVRTALPNSVRVNGNAIEMVNVVNAGRYRAQSGGTDHLDFTAADDTFYVLEDGFDVTDADAMVIYNTGQVGASVYEADATPHVRTSLSTTFTTTDVGTETEIALGAAHQFAFPSPQHRFFLIDTPITYLCDTTAGTFTRYWAYTLQVAQPTNAAAAPLSTASNSLLAEHVAACSFTYSAGTATRAGLLTIDLQLSDSGERIQLLHQVHVVNVP